MDLYRRILIGLGLMMCALAMLAQDKGLPQVSITAEHFNEQSGLSYNDVFAVAEDRRGLIWIGTRYGLNRFDGRRFKTYRLSDGLEYEGVDGIMVDGELLVLMHIDPAAGANVHPSATVINTITEEITPFGEYWAAVLPFSWDDLLQIESSESRAYPVFRLKTGKAFLYLGAGRFQPLSLQPKEHVMHRLPDGSLWTLESGVHAIVCRYRDQVGRVQKTYRYLWESWYESGHWVGYNAQRGHAYITVPKRQEGVVYTLLKTLSVTEEVSSRRLALATRVQNEAQNKTTGIYPSASMVLFPALDMIWVGEDIHGRLEAFEGEPVASTKHLFEGVHLGQRQSLIKDSVIWLPGHNGLYKLAFNRVSFDQLMYRPQDGRNYRTIFQREGLMYGVHSRGIVRLDRAIDVDSSIWSNERVLDLVWVGTPPRDTLWSINGGSLTRIIGRTAQATRWSMPMHTAWAIVHETSEVVWVGSRGLYSIHLPTQKITKQPTEPYTELEQAIVYQFWCGAGDTTWLVSTHGLYRVHPRGGILDAYGRTRHGSHYLPAIDFRYLYAAPGDSIYWLATGGDGLLRWNFKKETYQQYRFGATPTNTLHAIVPDDFGYLWCSTDKGLIQFDPRTERYRVYLGQDGLLVDEFNRISHFKDTLTGELYFGTVNGVLRFHPRDFKEALTGAVAGAPYIVDAYELRRGESKATNALPQILDQVSIAILPDVVQLTLGFGITNGLWNTAVAYEYRIVRDTSAAQRYTALRGNELQLGRLPYGRSYLQVKAITNTGQPLSHKLVIPLTVYRPYYLTWWFIALGVGVLLGLAYAAYAYQRLQDQRRNDLRTRIARDLHDNVGASLSSILMQVQLLGLLPRGERRQEVEAELIENTHHTIDMMRDVVWAIDARNDSYEDLLVRLEEQLLDLEQGRGIEYRFEVRGGRELPSLSPEVRQHIYFIFREAITNTFKHSKARAVTLRVAREERQLVIEYTERLPLEQAEAATKVTFKSGQGISNMRQRATEAGGRLIIETSEQAYRVRYEQPMS